MINVRRWAETALARGGPAAIARRLHRRNCVVLAYHNIVASRSDAGADSPLHLAKDEFARQMLSLKQSHDVVSVSDLLLPAVPSDKPRAAITFDDAYRGAVCHGAEVLADVGLPATIFVTPGRLDGDAFWWDSLQGAPSDVERFRDHVLESLGGDDRAARIAAPAFGLSRVNVHVDSRTAYVSDLRGALSSHPGLTYGAHSWTHANLASLAGSELSSELERPREWFVNNGFDDRVIDWVAYPYGRAGAVVEAAAKAAGYNGALSTASEWIVGEVGNKFAVPRISIPGNVTIDGFSLRVSGLRR